MVLFRLVQVTGKLAALKGLDARLQEIRYYLDLVVDGKLPLNHEILYHLQVTFVYTFAFYFWASCINIHLSVCAKLYSARPDYQSTMGTHVLVIDQIKLFDHFFKIKVVKSFR